MAKAIKTSPPLLLLLLLLPILLTSFTNHVSATDHIVGGHLGWNPNINYTNWSNNQSFFINDLISFRYQKNMYNVFEVNKTGYDNCTLDGIAGNWSSGKDFITLTRPGDYYFICGNGLCFSGMKVAIKVVSLPSPPVSPSHFPSGNSSSSAVGSYGTKIAGIFGIAVWIGFWI